MKENLVTWLTLLLFAGAVFAQQPPTQPPTPPPEIKQTPPSPPELEKQQPPPPPPPVVNPPTDPAVVTEQPPAAPTAPATPATPVIVVPPAPPALIATATQEPDYLEWDKVVLSDQYQRNHFTYAYQSAVLRRALSVLKFKYTSALVQKITMGDDGVVEPVLKQALRAFPAAWNAWVAKSENQFDGHFAAVARITFREGYTINCVSTITRRKVDPHFLWVRLTPCWPDFGTQAAWKSASELDLEGFLDLDTLTFERTPHVNIGPDSFKSRRAKR